MLLELSCGVVSLEEVPVLEEDSALEEEVGTSLEDADGVVLDAGVGSEEVWLEGAGCDETSAEELPVGVPQEARIAATQGMTNFLSFIIRSFLNRVYL